MDSVNWWAVAGLVVVVGAAVYAFTALWWWALVGMPGPVIVAHTVTVMAVGVLGCLAAGNRAGEDDRG